MNEQPKTDTEIRSRGQHRKKRDELDLEKFRPFVSSMGKVQARFSQRERVLGDNVNNCHGTEAGTQGTEVRREHGVGVGQEWPLQ